MRQRSRIGIHGGTTDSGLPDGGGVSPVAPGDRDIGWQSNANAGSALQADFSVPGAAEASSALGEVGLGLGSRANAATAMRADANSTMQSNTNSQSVAFAAVTNIVGMDDARVDEAAATTNFDGQDLGVESDGALGGNAQHSVLQIDMTGWSGFGIDEVRLVVNTIETTLGDAVDANCQLRHVATSPFTESTVNWNNHTSNQGTLILTTSHTFTTNAVGGGDLEQTVTWGTGLLDNLVGRWMFILIIQNAGTLQVNPVFFYSGETGTGGQRPRIEIDATR